MDLLSPALDDLLAQAVRLVRDSVGERMLQCASETELAQQLSAIARLGRVVEAWTVNAVGEAMRRSETPVRDEAMTTHVGCRNVSELLQTLALVSPQTAARLQRPAKAVRPTVASMTGELLDAASGRPGCHARWDSGGRRRPCDHRSAAGDRATGERGGASRHRGDRRR